MIVTVKDAQSDLKKLVQRALEGEEIVIAGEAENVGVKLVRVDPIPFKRPQYGRLAGKLPPMDLERFRPLTDEELREEGFELCLPDDK
jgi:antitoxin (DNA-binding transcriptional repressor) of toxin-antitoxin stability system